MPTDALRETSEPETGFRLTGPRVLAILLAVFGFIFAVNGFMVYAALTSTSDTVVESSYRAGQHFNQEIAAARAQAERAWTVAAETTRRPDGRARIDLSAVDRDARPVAGVRFRATLRSPFGQAHDRVVELAPVAGADGRFEGETTGVGEGRWTLLIEGEGAEGRLFFSENTLLLR